MKLALKVIYFAINYRQTRGSIIAMYYCWFYLGRFRRSSHRNRRNLPSSTTPLSFDAPAQGTPANIPINLIFPELDSLAYIFVADSMGLSSFKFEQWAPKDASFLRQSACWPFKVIQVHPRSSILVPIESAYMTSY